MTLNIRAIDRKNHIYRIHLSFIYVYNNIIMYSHKLYTRTHMNNF